MTGSAGAPPACRPEARAPLGAIVVLGCRLRPDGTASAALRRRVARGVALYQEGRAPVLVLSGGGTSIVPEAEIMRRLARAAGVPEAALAIEPRSRNTLENARETAQILHERGLSAILLVSDRVHLPRAALLFRRAGVKIAALAAAPPPALPREAALALREIAALARTLLCLVFRCR